MIKPITVKNALAIVHTSNQSISICIEEAFYRSNVELLTGGREPPPGLIRRLEICWAQIRHGDVSNQYRWMETLRVLTT